MKYKITNLIREDFNKSVVFYYSDTNKVKSYYTKLLELINKDKESDLYANIKKNDSGNLIIQLHMVCINLLVDDSWWSDSDLIPLLDKITMED